MKNKNRDSLKTVMQLVAIVLTLILGFGGYYYYYSHITEGVTEGAFLVSRAVYSTIRLFTAAFDMDYDKALALEHSALLISALEIAKWTAIVLTGHLLFKLVRPFISRFIISVRKIIWLGRKNQVFIAGNNTDSGYIYRSVKKPYSPVIIAKTVAECDALLRDGVKAVTEKSLASSTRFNVTADAELWIESTLKNAITHKKSCTVIINTESDEENLRLCQIAADYLNKALGEYKSTVDSPSSSTQEIEEAKKHIVNALAKLRIFVFGSSAYTEIYAKIRSDSLGVLRYINPYQLTAFDFVNEYPLTGCIDGSQFEKYVDSACISDELDFNTVFVGFGETNQEIFSVSFANNQFIKKAEGGIPKLKKVNYHIFDKNISRVNLCNTVFRYKNEFLDCIADGSEKADNYFSLTDFPANISFYESDANDSSFYKEIRKILSPEKESVNCVIISIGNDLESINIAERLAAKAKEWGVKNLRIFARAETNNSQKIIDSVSSDAYTTFGNKERLVYNFDKITRNSFEELAIDRHIMYEYENDRKSESRTPYDELETNAKYNWFVELDNAKRMSNLYCILSLRTKLNLIGLDYTDRETDGVTIKSNAEYFDIYAKGNAPAVEKSGDGVSKDIYSYESLPLYEDFKSGSIRNNLTVQEHYRWNAYMLACGFIPQDRASALDGKPKDYKTRKHCNICNFEGLFDFRSEMAEASGNPESSTDVIKYDYQLMDDAWWFLTSKDCKVFKKD